MRAGSELQVCSLLRLSTHHSFPPFLRYLKFLLKINRLNTVHHERVCRDGGVCALLNVHPHLLLIQFLHLQQQADPHINTAHGHMISYWDGCVHYLMYLLMIAAIAWGDSYRAIGLYWVGSFLMRAIVYILGNAVGKYGTQVSPLFALHMLYISVSVWACFRIFCQPSIRDVQLTNIQEAQRTRLLQRPLDLLFIIYLIPALAFCVFRGLVVLDCPSKWCQDYTQQYEPYLKDPSAYPKLQMLVSLLYSGPYYIITLYGLLVPGCEWMTDLTLVHSGALAQAQFAHIGASLHTRTRFSYRVPADSQPVFLLVNVLYTVVPQALCYRCCTRPAFFLRPMLEKKIE
ncbi:transmembrane 6 superfamily member 1-like isoform X2 [Brachyistius frenatus]|uniref:transmembrane 6 superfamily member 1-like isoform X2 n=1 Tax=Brachyistius frenatus TaxID=100188 RepID=UPI0037E77006